MNSEMRSGTIVVGYDGTRTSEHALRETAGLLGPRTALVVVVWKAGLAFELIELPASSIGLPPAPLELHTALEADRSIFEEARRAAQHGAGLARVLGMDAEGLAVAEDPGIPVSETLLRVASERSAQAMVIGAHAHGNLLGSTSRGVLRHARCPVLVVRDPMS
jgi:nucleotide-binding universal stress UspA family protein